MHILIGPNEDELPELLLTGHGTHKSNTPVLESDVSSHASRQCTYVCCKSVLLGLAS